VKDDELVLVMMMHANKALGSDVLPVCISVI
jgi:hypothetical protein